MLCTLLYTICNLVRFTGVDNLPYLNEDFTQFLRKELIIVTFALL